MTKLALLPTLLLSLYGCAGAPPREQPLSGENLKQYQACHHTGDCVRVNNGCCDCANGGDTVAIHRKFEKEFRDLFPCRDVACTQKAGDCKFHEPSCEAGLCKLGPPKKLFPKR
jgi:hypothetical protein